MRSRTVRAAASAALPFKSLPEEAAVAEVLGTLVVSVVLTRTITVVLNSTGEVEYFVATGVDVTEQRRNQEHLLQLATTDSLTGLVNRTTFQDVLSHALDGRTRHGAALLFCDLDGFKGVNDSMGHATGDELLVAVAKRLRRQVRTNDVVARLGGDEFVVVAEGAGDFPHAVRALAHRLIDAVGEPIPIDEVPATVLGSIGVAIAEGADTDPIDLLRAADAAMYTAKRSRAGLVFADES